MILSKGLSRFIRKAQNSANLGEVSVAGGDGGGGPLVDGRHAGGSGQAGKFYGVAAL
jgi:hypothetical protein